MFDEGQALDFKVGFFPSLSLSFFALRHFNMSHINTKDGVEVTDRRLRRRGV